MPKLSVITVNLNNAVGLQKTMESVLNQTFTDLEYIIIDGGSRDESIRVIKKYIDKISYWISEPDNGVYNAMNKGILKSNGKYCLFLNSGDFLKNEDVIKKVFDKPLEEDLIYGSIIYAYKDKKMFIDSIDVENLTFRYFINYTLPHPGTFIKRDLFGKIGYYNENYIIASDFEFFLSAIFKYGATLKRIPDIISVFDMDGISSQHKNSSIFNNERKEILLKHFPRFLPDYIYMEELEYKFKHNFWVLITKIIKGITKK